jgi:ribosomal protein S18 acetylase RimI-like enzyme
MTIRPALSTDAPAAAQLLLEAIRDIAYQLTGKETEAEVLTSLEAWFRAKGNRFSYQHVLVEERDSLVVGLILCYHGKDATAIDQPLLNQLRLIKKDPQITIVQEAEVDEYYIDALSVVPAWSGQGIGTALIQAAELYARVQQYDRIALNANADNIRAIRLYDRLEFRSTKIISFNGNPYSHMIKLLN